MPPKSARACRLSFSHAAQSRAASCDERSAADQSRKRIARPPSRLSRPANEFSKASHCLRNMGLSLVYSNRTLGPSASAAAEAGAVAAAASLSGWRAAASAAMACTRAPWPSKVGRRFSASSVLTLARSSRSSACMAFTSASFPLPVDMLSFTYAIFHVWCCWDELVWVLET